MDLSAIKRLLQSERPSDDYIAGVEGFLKFAYSGKRSDSKIRCPCVKCVNRPLHTQETVYEHLVCNGLLCGYTIWGCHGETASYISANKDSLPVHPSLNSNMRQVVHEAFGYVGNEHHTTEPDVSGFPKDGPDAETQAFFDLLRDADEPLWEGCELSKLSFLVLLFHVKSTNKWSNKSINDLLQILQLALPNGSNIPKTFMEAQKIIAKLGLRYEKIHVCPNGCQLYWKDKKDNDFCSKCGASRWKNKADNTSLTKKQRRKATPKKVLRYFPIKPRLKRLFMNKETAKLTRWHDEERTKDGALRHPADSEVWKITDSYYPHIASGLKNQSGWRCQSVGSYKKKPMTAAAFSADGSVLAVAAESVITLWDPDNNALVGMIAEALSPVTKLSFIGTSAFLMSVSQSSRPQVAVWNVSNLSMQWSYSLFAEAACCSSSRGEFAVLARLSCSDGVALTEQDGVILLFDAENPNPVSSWSVKKARGGSIAFVKGDPTFDANSNNTRDGEASLLVYVNGSHEYVIFDPRNNESQISKSAQKKIQAEEHAPIGYASIYGELPKLESKKEVSDIPFIPSERPWETIFSGSSHVLPPLTKLCSAFLASLLEKRPVANE